MEVCWVGIRESEAYHSDFVGDSISVFGSKPSSLEQKMGRRVNHNADVCGETIGFFHADSMQAKLQEDKDYRFMLYSQIYTYYLFTKRGLTDKIVCLNDQATVEFLNDKFKTMDLMRKSGVPVLDDYRIMRGKDIDCTSGVMVAQSSQGSGGSGTFVVTKENKDKLLDGNQEYLVSQYREGNVPLNAHILISDKAVTVLPCSIQNIENIDNRLIYKGNDFISYRNKDIIGENTDKQFNDMLMKIGGICQSVGYRGVMGIDAIAHNGNVYFMEVNPRFQNSSSVLNMGLRDNNLPSLQELNYRCFYGGDINIRTFDVNYSSYIRDYGAKNSDIPFKPVVQLDVAKPGIVYDSLSYVCTDLYDKPVWLLLSRKNNACNCDPVPYVLMNRGCRV